MSRRDLLNTLHAELGIIDRVVDEIVAREVDLKQRLAFLSYVASCGVVHMPCVHMRRVQICHAEIGCVASFYSH